MYQYAGNHIGQLIDAHPIIFDFGMSVLIYSAKYVFAPATLINKYILLAKAAEYKVEGKNVNFIVQQ